MRDDVIAISECSEFRRTLQARPPRVVHGTAILLSLLVGAAATWASVTEASLVVRGPGVVRSKDAPLKALGNEPAGDQVYSTAGGRVVQVLAKKGDPVRAGDVLVRLDTQVQDNEIARQRRTIEAAEAELSTLEHLEALEARQYEVTRAKADAEVVRAKTGTRRARFAQSSDHQLYRTQLESAKVDVTRLAALVDQGAASMSELRAARSRVAEAQAQLSKTAVPVDDGDVAILESEGEQAQIEYELKLAKMAAARTEKQVDIEAQKRTLANLELAHEQAQLRAPADGLVAGLDVAVGDIVSSGQSVITIARDADIEVDAAIQASDVAKLQVGLPVRITLDAFDPSLFGALDGTLRFISPAAETQSTSSGQVSYYMVRVAVSGDALSRGEYRGQVTLGMTGRIELITGKRRVIAIVFERIRQAFTLN